MMCRKTTVLQITLAALALAGFASAQAQTMQMLVKHSSVSNGVDGVKRSSEFSERIIRSADTVWISRVIPAETQNKHVHGKKGGDEHKHLDVATATRWITRDADKAVVLRLVPNAEQVIVKVTKPDYGNVGFDGSWMAAWSLIDPATLKRMKTGPTAGDLTTYTLAENGRNLKVVWNAKLQMPTLVQSWDKSSRRETMVEVGEAPTGLPWEKVKAYSSKDYSDYLD